MTGKDLLKLLKNNGWVIDRINGSHYIMCKDGESSISVPIHANKDMKKGTLNRILKLTGLK